MNNEKSAEQAFLREMELGLGSAHAIKEFITIPEDCDDPKSIWDCIANINYAYDLVNRKINSASKSKGGGEEVKAVLQEAANEYADKHGFRVPFDGSNKFYDDDDVRCSKEGFIAGAEWQASQPKEDVGVNDCEMLDWLQSMMTDDSNYCEIFFAGLRDFTGKANAYQIESNPQRFETLTAPTVREAIALAMGKQFKSTVKEDEQGWDWVAIFYGTLKELVDLKHLKETEGKTDVYLERQPKAWHLANEAVKLWEKSDYGASPLPKEDVGGEVFRWVKASERLPIDTAARISWRFSNKSVGGLGFKYIYGFRFEKDGKFTRDYKNIEWLEPIPTITK